MSELIWLVGVLVIPVVLILVFRRLYREDPGSRRRRRYVDLDENERLSATSGPVSEHDSARREQLELPIG